MEKIKFYHEKFEEFCAQQRWTKINLAKVCGVTRQTVALWATGKIIPNEARIRELADILNVKPSDISAIEESIPVSNRDISQAIFTWSSLSESSADSRAANLQFFFNKFHSHYKEQEELFLLTKALLSSMESIFYVKDKNLQYAVANKAFLDNVSLNSNFNVKGKADSEFFPALEAEQNQKEDSQVFNSGKAIINAERFIYGSRKRRIGLTSKYPVMDEKNQIIGVMGITVDITNQKKNEIMQSLIIEALGKVDIVLSMAQDNKIVFLTGSLDNVFGIDKNLKEEEIQKYFLTKIVHPDDREEQRKYFETSTFPPERTYRIIHPEKGKRIIKVVNSKIEFYNKTYSISLSMDVTK